MPPADSADFARLWAARFEQIPSGELTMASLRGKPLVVNFWATWCPPCVKEMPELDRFAQAHAAQGWQVLGLAIDQRSAVQQFLGKTPVRFPIALAGAEGTQWVRELGNPAGGLPFTAVFDAQGRLVQRKLGATDQEELRRWAAALSS
jgi:thiol-disulfide isomerase/thioredoxin